MATAKPDAPRGGGKCLLAGDRPSGARDGLAGLRGVDHIVADSGCIYRAANPGLSDAANSPYTILHAAIQTTVPNSPQPLVGERVASQISGGDTDGGEEHPVWARRFFIEYLRRRICVKRPSKLVSAGPS